jgi:nitrogen fixation NifU-like protein
MSEAYSEIVVDHFRNPRNVGILRDPDGVGKVENPASGACLSLYLSVAHDRVRRAKFQSQGCTATISAGSMLTAMLAGRSLEQAEAISRSEIEQALGGLPPTKRHAAALAEAAVRAAVSDYWAQRRHARTSKAEPASST